MCPGVDSASKNEYQDNPGGKDTWCIRLTTYHLHVLIVTSWNPVGLFRPVMGQLYLYLFSSGFPVQVTHQNTKFYEYLCIHSSIMCKVTCSHGT